MFSLLYVVRVLRTGANNKGGGFHKFIGFWWKGFQGGRGVNLLLLGFPQRYQNLIIDIPFVHIKFSRPIK